MRKLVRAAMIGMAIVSLFVTGCAISKAYEVKPHKGKTLEQIDADLCKIYRRDQKIREIINSDDDEVGFWELVNALLKGPSIDKANRKYVVNLLDDIGWPEGLSEDANDGIFFVIQHSPLDVHTKYIALIREKAEQGVVQNSSVALVEDRILIMSGKKQIYGSQLAPRKGKSDKLLYILPVENPDKLDSLRASVGLPSLSEYMQVIEDNSRYTAVWDKNLTLDDF